MSTESSSAQIGMTNSSTEKSRLIENVLAAVGAILPANLSEEVKANLSTTVTTALDNMDIVTRQEIEVQETVLRRAREKINELEARIEELEAKQK